MIALDNGYTCTSYCILQYASSPTRCVLPPENKDMPYACYSL